MTIRIKSQSRTKEDNRTTNQNQSQIHARSMMEPMIGRIVLTILIIRIRSRGSQMEPRGNQRGRQKAKKELHSTQSMNESTKKTSVVCINEEPEVKVIDHPYSDLNYSSDEASAMMVHAPSSNQVNGITVIEAPTKDGSCFVTTVLIDNGCM